MKIYKQLTYILLFSFLGEIASKGLNLPVPGSVIGMLLLFLALQFNIVKLEDVEVVGHFLIDNLAILFVPAGVSLMIYFSVIKNSWLALLVISVLTTAISIAFIGVVVQKIKLRFEGDKVNLTEEDKKGENHV
ncbi:CidA/LrgA family protein [Isobaculum melis]|uniref:Holin-like protein n=1 Tax=Isobaculum melis TaxID=142588 RepID=A0A1H9RK53_9LACT|nr:CidA/LrgA family protein [Isobaculum melis]SER73017.1 holin-like protein [Isobaculum melis]